jgi:hypothetical protein
MNLKKEWGSNMKYKLSKTRSREFAIRLEKECAKRNFISAKGAIRTGCFIKWYSISQNQDLEGVVCKHRYGGGENSWGESRNLHYFTVETGSKKVVVRGKNLYPYLLQHKKGEIT